MEARLLVIINNAAARARAAWPFVERELRAAGVAFDAHVSLRVGDARERARDALRRGVETIAAVGGDGTLGEVASGFFERDEEAGRESVLRPVNTYAALAPLPAGTGDDFARGLCGGRRAELKDWVGRLVRHCRRVDDGSAGEVAGTTRRVDALDGSVDAGARRFVCLNAATLGVGADVASRVAAQPGALRRLSGKSRFALAAVHALAAWRNRRVRISVDGGTWEECRTNLVAVVNGPYAGGGMNFSPDADVGDGLLDVVTASDLSRAEVVRELTRIHKGGHLANPKVYLRRGASVRLETFDPREALPVEADGDVRGHTPAEFRVVPAALRLVI